MKNSGKLSGIGYLWKEKTLYLMLLPGILFFVIYRYIPMFGLVIGFQNFNPGLGFFRSKFAGFRHFERLFTDPVFFRLFRNTLLISFYNLLFFFPLPIILALLMNEVRSLKFKKVIQTLTYLPHFVSWVVICSMTFTIFTTESGYLNLFLFKNFGIKVPFLTSEAWFRPMIILQHIWRDTGWGTILFMAALSSIDPQLYEAAEIDGATRWQQTWNISLPCLRPTIIVLLILRLGHMLDTGVEQFILMVNPLNRGVGEVFDTYVYRIGIQQGQFSYSTVIGMFRSVVSLVMVYLANLLAKKTGEEGIF